MNQLKKPIVLLFCFTFFLSAQVDYHSEIQEPIFNILCTECHGSNSGLSLANYNNLMTGGDHGPAVVPFDTANSIIVQKISPDPLFGNQMPADDPTYFDNNPDLWQTFIDWINEGALEFSLPPDSGEVVVTVQDTVFDGYTGDIVVIISLSNPDTLVGGLQFDLEDFPDLLSATDVIAVGRAEGFDVSFTNLGNGHLRVVLVSTIGDTITAGDGPILEVHYDGGDIPSAVIDLIIMNLVVSDPDGGEIEAGGENGTLKIGPTASLFVIGGTADAADTLDIFITLTNYADVGSLQFDLFDNPNLVDIDSVRTLGRAEAFEAN